MNDTPRNNGIGFVGMLQILFIGLKLTNLIDWSWVWVLAPTWITTVIVVFAIAFILWWE